MIVVSGTKRSGTSMWMQALRAAGLPVLGDAFPEIWAAPLRAANPRGFWESSFRDGVYFATNPHPRTGAFLHPTDVRGHAVKVFIPGLLRSDLAYLDRVIATVREPRAYCRSATRLASLDEASPKSESAPAWAVWWRENFQLVRDVTVRRYPAVLRSYESVVDDPSSAADVLRWTGAPDPEAGVAAIAPELRTGGGEIEAELPVSAMLASFDALWEAIHTKATWSRALLADLNRVQDAVQAMFPAP